MKTKKTQKTIKKPEIIYIEAGKNNFEPLNALNKEALKTLPKTLLIAYSIQFKPLAEQIAGFLKSISYYITDIRQVLGCTKLSPEDKKNPILLICSGRFHALNLAMQTEKPVYIYNSGKISIISSKDIGNMKAKKQAALSKFLFADKIGILVSTKPGQNRLKEAEQLKSRLKSQGKQVYLFISNEINLSEIENFKVDSWINTACPGLALDRSNILNIDDLPSANHKK